MVYYFTSFNVRILQKISEEYAQHPDCPPEEYMKRYAYVDHFPDNVDGDKLTWIVDTFLDLQKHCQFLQDVCSKVDSDMSPAESQYLVIILYAILFQIHPEDKDHIYRCIFNLGKDLIRRFTTVFSNNEMITFVSQLARVHYDNEFITNRIIAPLFSWQPYISDMCHDFETHIRKSFRGRVSTGHFPTNILGKPSHPGQPLNTADTTNAAVDTKIPKKKMLTKSTIDLRLQHISKQNKLKAERLRNEVETLEFACARNTPAKSDTVANLQKDKKQRPATAAKRYSKTALASGCATSTMTKKSAGKTA